MALSFREMLGSNATLDMGGHEQSIGEFLATHREKPRYLRSFQFLTAIIEEERNDSGQNPEQIQPVVTRFWEAMSYNVDGIIELGLEGKVKLLMYLLGQVKTGMPERAEQFAQIPNLQVMRDFIGEEIFKDIDHWLGDLKASEYRPEGLKKLTSQKN